MEIDLNQNGNRCGHRASHARAFLFSHLKNPRFPGFLKLAIERIAAFYRQPTYYLEALATANGKASQQRSERREACVGVLQCLMSYLQLTPELRVGTPADNSKAINSLRLSFIATKTDLGLKRVWRAMQDLKSAGYIDYKRAYTEIDGKVFAVSRCSITRKTFHHLHIHPQIVDKQLKFKKNIEIKRKHGFNPDYIKGAKDGIRALKTIVGSIAVGAPKPQTGRFRPVSSYQHRLAKGRAEERRQWSGRIHDLLLQGFSLDEATAKVGL